MIKSSPAQENPNLQMAEIFVDELARGGLSAVVIAPGSRSTPLALAFWAHPAVRVYRHLDERGAGFFALGMALAEDKPVAVLCTSGTAAANFHPAIIEAFMSQVPLLILTADRPFELRHSGANQTIDQVKMFGDHVRWAVDVSLPEEKPTTLTKRNMRTLAARALAKASGIIKGPIHLNFPFRKPFEPDDIQAWLTAKTARDENWEMGKETPYSTIDKGVISPSDEQVKWLADIIAHNPRGLIICGPRCPDGSFPEFVSKLAQTAGYPLLADPLSGVRYRSESAGTIISGAYETYLQADQAAWPQPDVIIRFGALPISKWLNSYLHNVETKIHIHVRENGIWADEHHQTRTFLQANESRLCQDVTRVVRRDPDHEWQAFWGRLEASARQGLTHGDMAEIFDGHFVTDLLQFLPTNSTLMAGNSLPVRHVDQFGVPNGKDIRVVANRGASGIDGNIATGLGLAAGSAQPVVILVGDITFYHDSNSLEAIKSQGIKNVTIVLLNNGGGGIFRRLPIAQIEDPFQELFLTPHEISFAGIAAAYDVHHTIVEDLESFKSLLQQELAEPETAIIEVRTDGQKDAQFRQKLIHNILKNINNKES